MGAGVDIEGSVGGEAVEEPEGTVADGKGVGKKPGVEGRGSQRVDVEGGNRIGEGGLLAWCCWERWVFAVLGLLFSLDVVDDVDDIAWT